MTKPKRTSEQLARDYAHWVAPEMIALLEKALLFIRENPHMFPKGEEAKTMETLKGLKEMLEEDA